MSHHEMTIADVLEDPLIRQMMDADRVSLEEFERLLVRSANMLFDKGQPRTLPQTQDNAASPESRVADEVRNGATVPRAKQTNARS